MHKQTKNADSVERFSLSFRDILKRSLSTKQKLRAPKLELSGILIPCYQEMSGHVFRFKLGTHTEEYLLSMNNKLMPLAQKAGWEDVTVKGRFINENKIFEVEKITINDIEDAGWEFIAS